MNPADDDDGAFVDEYGVLGEEGAYDPEHEARLVRTLECRFGDSIYEAARSGDLSKLKQRVELDSVDLNVLDHYNASPLYYASLCGHYDCVVYLLEKGARCETATHDGERCHYAALTDAVRSMLRKFEAANRNRGPLFAFTHRHFDNPLLADVEFELADGARIRAHRALLAARSPYFRARFSAGGAWSHKREVVISNSDLDAGTLRVVLSYLYTERLLCTWAALPSVARLSRNLGLPQLAAFVTHLAAASRAAEAGGSLVALDLGQPYVMGDVSGLLGSREQQQMGSDADGGEALLQAVRDLGLRRALWLALLRNPGAAVIPPELWDGEVETEEGGHTSTSLPHCELRGLSDVVVSVQGVDFHSHQFVLKGRSKYFEAALRFQSSVLPASSREAIPAVPRLELHSASPRTFARILEYLYCDVLLPMHDLGDVIEALQLAEEYAIVDGIRPLLVAQAVGHICSDTLVDLWSVGELLHLQRLTQACSRFAARHLEELVDDAAFLELVSTSAATITGRHQADSIPVLDEIRSAVLAIWGQTRAEMVQEAAGSAAPSAAAAARVQVRARKLALVEQLTVRLGLRAAATLDFRGGRAEANGGKGAVVAVAEIGGGGGLG